ncbi:hypothetical protein AB0903_33640 [Streptomyces sp. NPDC048389]|uniref:hypothetical protein n=1 Tax=Streptomyces sp. NPDC048389 TaxID=3154622 RepID=UPI003455196D
MSAQAPGSRICRTPREAFEAGFTAPCEHGVRPPDCARCRLTEAEIGRLAVLLKTSVPPATEARETAA